MHKNTDRISCISLKQQTVGRIGRNIAFVVAKKIRKILPLTIHMYSCLCLVGVGPHKVLLSSTLLVAAQTTFYIKCGGVA